MIDEDLRDFCIADPVIGGIVGNESDSARFSTGRLPSDDNGDPLVEHYVYVATSDETPIDSLDYNRDDLGAYIGGLAEFNLSIECISVDTAVAKSLARAIQKRLHGHYGEFRYQHRRYDHRVQ